MHTRAAAVIFGLFLACSLWAQTPADLILRNGKIVTVEALKPEAQAIAISGSTRECN